MIRRLLIFLFIFSPVLLGACSSYDLTVNDRVVYTPRPLFSDYSIEDPALADCVARAIAEYKVSSAAQLQELDCPGAAVASLKGLATFTALSRIELSHNEITDLAPLSAITSLQELYLNGNRVIDPIPLYRLPALAVLDLRGNGSLRCPDQAALITLESLLLPQHCKR